MAAETERYQDLRQRFSKSNQPRRNRNAGACKSHLTAKLWHKWLAEHNERMTMVPIRLDVKK